LSKERFVGTSTDVRKMSTAPHMTEAHSCSSGPPVHRSYGESYCLATIIWWAVRELNPFVVGSRFIRESRRHITPRCAG